MKTKITILLAVGLILAAATTQAQGPAFRDRRDIRYDRMNIRHDRFDITRDRRDGNFYALRHDRRDIRFDRRAIYRDRFDLRHDRRCF